MTPARVLITGAAGFIGSSLAAHFRAQGAEVVVDAVGVSRVPLTAAALTWTTDRLVPDAIIHAAGSGTVGQVQADPAAQVPANLAATLQVLEYARASAPRAHVVLLSSAAVYGSANDGAQREEDIGEPVSLYGLSKSQSEQLLAHYSRRHGLQTTAVRLFSVYGPGLRKQLLWDAMIKFGAGRADFFGTGQECRDWVHIDDVCRFMRCLLAQPAAAGFEVFNCGGHAATTSEVLNHLAAEAGAGHPSFNGQTRAGDPARLVADCSKAAQRLGWQPRIGWREGMSGYARWFRAQADVAAAAAAR